MEEERQQTAAESPVKEKGEQKEPRREEASPQPAPRSPSMNCRPAPREARGATRDRRERRQTAQRLAVPRGEVQPGKEARDGTEKPEDSTRTRTGGQTKTGGPPGRRPGSRNDRGRPTIRMYVSEAVSLRSVCLGAGPPSFLHCRFRFLGPPGFGGTTKAA